MDSTLFSKAKETSKAQTGLSSASAKREGSKLSRLIGPIRTKVKNVIIQNYIQEAGKKTYDKKGKKKQGINNRSLYFALLSLEMCVQKNASFFLLLPTTYPEFSFWCVLDCV